MMPLTDVQLKEQVGSQIRRRATADRAPSPPLSPPRRRSFSSIVIQPDEPIIGQRTAAELGQQVHDEIRGYRAMDEFERRSATLAQPRPIVPFRPDPEDAGQPSPASNPDSVASDSIRPEEYTDLYGFLIFAFVGLFFYLIGRQIGEDDSKQAFAFWFVCNFAASCMGVGAAKILYDWKFPRPEKHYTECRLVLKEMKRMVIQTQKQKQDFCDGLDRIVDIDRYIQRIAREGALEAYGRDWQRWERLRERYGALQQVIPPVDLNIPSRQQDAEETENVLEVIVYED